MIFYRLLVNVDFGKLERMGRKYANEEQAMSEAIGNINSRLYARYCVDKQGMLVISDIAGNELTVVVAFKAVKSDICEWEKVALQEIEDAKLISSEEITQEEYEKELVRAYHRDWNRKSYESIARELGIKIKPESRGFFEPPMYAIEEKILSCEKSSKKEILARLDEIMASDNFYEEIDRIYSTKNAKRFAGHPVHYLITAGDKGAANDIISILVPALMKNKRLLGGRTCMVDKISPRAYRDENFYNLFPTAEGSTLIINLAGEQDASMYANGYHELAEELGKKLCEYGNDTLFIFVDVSGKRSISDETIAAILGNADMVQITEGHGDINRAKEYLLRLAKDSGYDDYQVDEITRYLPDERELYTVSDIYMAYNKWYGSGLKTHVYKAYKEKDLVKIERKKKVDKPYETLQNMIGLTDVKKVTDEILSVARVRKMRKELGLKDSGASMHMLFAGNPGTAKTTVARLIAQILKEEDVLKTGHIVECGRQDLVGKYVGWTAKIVEDKFKAARGGILFIDEAYSLVDGSNSYGAEAINTIVQMMENFREDVIVIFAGYPDKMNTFIEQNEGLASRIAFHLNFPDYNAEELSGILDLMLESRGYKLESEETRNKCLELFEKGCKDSNFGNGRFVRNMLEHAIMRQADRLLRRSDEKTVTKENAVLLTSDDFELIGLRSASSKYSAIGFSA